MWSCSMLMSVTTYVNHKLKVNISTWYFFLKIVGLHGVVMVGMWGLHKICFHLFGSIGCGYIILCFIRCKDCAIGTFVKFGGGGDVCHHCSVLEHFFQLALHQVW
jgi:hypothetical protein